MLIPYESVLKKIEVSYYVVLNTISDNYSLIQKKKIDQNIFFDCLQIRALSHCQKYGELKTAKSPQ